MTSIVNAAVASAREGAISPVPSAPYSARDICELALGQTGSFSVNDESPHPVKMRRALQYFDMIIAELAGVDKNVWLVGETYRFSWPADTRVDAVANIMGAAYPSLGIIMPIRAALLDEDGRRMGDLPLMRRWQYEQVEDKDETGRPSFLYFDRLAAEATVSICQVPDVATWQIELEAQTYARSVIGAQTGTEQSGDLQHGFAPEWQRFLVNQLSADIGNGPVSRVDLRYIADWRAVAENSLAKLQAWANREKKSGPSRTSPWGRSSRYRDGAWPRRWPGLNF